MKKKVIKKEATVSIDIEDIETKDLLCELLERKRYVGFDKAELGMFSDLFEDEPLTDNLLDEQKMEIITENLDKRSLEDIEKFFGVNQPYHTK